MPEVDEVCQEVGLRVRGPPSIAQGPLAQGPLAKGPLDGLRRRPGRPRFLDLRVRRRPPPAIDPPRRLRCPRRRRVGGGGGGRGARGLGRGPGRGRVATRRDLGGDGPARGARKNFPGAGRWRAGGPRRGFGGRDWALGRSVRTSGPSPGTWPPRTASRLLLVLADRPTPVSDRHGPRSDPRSRIG